ncbi:hypothetical protein [Clostridium butyricum]|nr:hypothetical protein [Clostridium butyricum]AXB86044.1 hypothetical protein DRB99_13995 [Clostridium butyricum]
MSFKDSIPGCFGSKDLVFARHFDDCTRARKMITEAFSETTSWGEFEESIVEFLKSKKLTDEQIEV